MTVHLDANLVIRMGRSGTEESRRVRALLASGARLGVSTIAWSEFLCGPLLPGEQADARQILGAPIPFLETDAELAARLFNVGGRRRGSFADCQIAAVALRARAALATENAADFARFAPARLMLARS